MVSRGSDSSLQYIHLITTAPLHTRKMFNIFDILLSLLLDPNLDNLYGAASYAFQSERALLITVNKANKFDRKLYKLTE